MEQDGRSRVGVLVGIVLAVFGAALMVLLKIMPPPHRDVDYMVAGSIATLVALLVVFLLMLATGQKAGAAFFTKHRPDD